MKKRLIGLGVLVVLIAVGVFFSALLEVHPSMPFLLFSELLVWSIGAPIAGASVISTFSHIIEGGGKPQGLAMGWIGSAGSFGRIFSPIIFAYCGQVHIASILCLVLAIFCFLGAIGVLRFNSAVASWKDAHRYRTGSG